MSSSSSLDATECAVFGVLTALGYLVGIYFSIARRRKQITSSENERVAAELEAFLGGRRLPGIALAVSVLASAVNGMNIVAVAGHYYAYGFHLMWTVVWIPVVGAFVASTLVPLLYGLRVSTVFQVFISFYSSASGPFAGLMLLAISSPWVKAKLSFFWMSFLGALLTILLGNIFSIAKGEH
ncbi:hypothetical protein MTO96_017878 [Rhipicephalus appendiculatus]